MAASSLISLGVGAPASIAHLVLLGLSPTGPVEVVVAGTMIVATYADAQDVTATYADAQDVTATVES